MINQNNQLINSFFDDKINLNLDISIIFDGETSTLNFDLTFKKRITSFDFEKIMSYCKVDVLESEHNYKKVVEYFESIFENIKVDKVNYSETSFTISEIQNILSIIFTKIKRDISDLKKK